MFGGVCDAWVERMVTQLADVGVHMVRDFVGSVLVLNKRLDEIGHKKVSHAVLNMMLTEVCEMRAWPE